jgi:hypothetical protein
MGGCATTSDIRGLDDPLSMCWASVGNRDHRSIEDCPELLQARVSIAGKAKAGRVGIC